MWRMYEARLHVLFMEKYSLQSNNDSESRAIISAHNKTMISMHVQELKGPGTAIDRS